MSDLISRQAAINLICEEGTRLERNGTVAMVEIKQWCVDLLEDLPAAQRWIPTSERLPEEHSEVLVTTNNGTVMRCDFFGFIGIHFVWKSAEGSHTYWDKEVVAWMPLPKPYQEDDNELD